MYQNDYKKTNTTNWKQISKTECSPPDTVTPFACDISTVHLVCHTSLRQVIDGEVITWDTVMLPHTQATKQYLVPQRVMFLYLCYYQNRPFRRCRLRPLSSAIQSPASNHHLQRSATVPVCRSTTAMWWSYTAKIPVIFDTCNTSFVCYFASRFLGCTA